MAKSVIEPNVLTKLQFDHRVLDARPVIGMDVVPPKRRLSSDVIGIPAKNSVKIATDKLNFIRRCGTGNINNERSMTKPAPR